MNKPVVWSYWNHEPIYHLKRMGNDGGTVFSLGEWVDDWYDRIHGKELVKKAAEIGINTVYTHFYKGLGLMFEHHEMQRTKEFTEIAHRYGIRVLGYVSMGSIYTESITREIPDVNDMLLKNRYGYTQSTLCDQYYRPKPCYNSEKYENYLKKVIKYGIEEIGLDGFHFDNSAFEFCYCDNCQRKFREFLKENLKNPYEVMGIVDFDYVTIPMLDYTENPEDIRFVRPKGNIHDVLMLWYLKFIRQSVADFHKKCFDYVKEISGGKAEVLHNPAFPRTDKGARCRGYDPTTSPESCDFIFVENEGGYFGKHYGRIVGQIQAFKYGERFGYKVFDTSWSNIGDKTYQFPENKSAIEGFVMHAAIYGGIAGVPWTVRSMKKGNSVAIDTPYLYEGLKESFEYFENNYDIFNSKSYNYVKVLHLPDNYISAEDAMKEMSVVLAKLTENNIRYSIITEDEISSLKSGETIILPHILYCKDSLYHDLKEISKKDVKIIATTGFGHYNENTKGRSNDNEILNLQGIKGSIITTKDEFIKNIHKKLSIDISDVLLETRITADGNLVLHILNADNKRDIKTANIVFEDKLLSKFKKTRVVAAHDATAEIDITDDKAIIKVNNLESIISIEFKE